MIIKDIEREIKGAGSQSKCTSIDTDDCQILDYTVLPPEASSPHISDDTTCDEKVA